MSSHGARLLASAIDGVCSCGGVGVVASLMYDVCVEYDGSVEYGGSEEYDGSVEYDVVVVCTKRTKDEEKRYLKIISPMNHMQPSIQ